MSYPPIMRYSRALSKAAELETPSKIKGLISLNSLEKVDSDILTYIHPIDIAPKCIYFSIMTQKSKRLSQFPTWECICGKSL